MQTSTDARPGAWNLGLILLTLAYPITHFIVRYIPNPFVPTANLALNMIFPVLAGYFYGPVSGALAGALGTGLSAFFGGDIYDAMSIVPHATMGMAAGWLGATRSQTAAALTIVLGHVLNLMFYWRFGLLSLDHPETLALGITTETTVGVVAIVLLIVLFQKWLYREPERRW